MKANKKFVEGEEAVSAVIGVISNPVPSPVVFTLPKRTTDIISG